jgi:NUDIX domain
MSPKTNRKFAAFTRNGREGLGISEIPEDGFCISVFLIIRQNGSPRNILMGYLNPDANWGHIGALTSDRIQAHKNGWMLPSCHLLYGESPRDAASRVAREQLGIENDKEFQLLENPKVYSELYAPKRHPKRKEHWDLQFVFEGQLESKQLHNSVSPSPWLRLEFVNIDVVNKDKIARSHEDILARL